MGNICFGDTDALDYAAVQQSLKEALFMFGPILHTALQWQSAAMAFYEVSVSAASVMQMRVLQMSLGTMTPGEATRMVMEKPSAFMRGAEKSAWALAENKGWAAATTEGLSPIKKAVESNAKRLSGTPAKSRSGARRR
jgi:hypothetical protein